MREVICMTAIYPFKEEGNWYKGNLHCHSTVSDGLLTPEKLVDLYRENDYNFLVFSEHEIFTDFTEFNTDNFIILPAVEYSTVNYEEGTRKRLQTHHVHGILGTNEMQNKAGSKVLKHNQVLENLKWDGQKTAQNMIDYLNDTGNICIYNHPNWSRTELNDFIDLEGYFALEIYNHCSELESHTGISTFYWDSLLKRGKKIWCVATDDNHNDLDDSCGGWVVVKAKELTHEAVTKALLEGSFYSSSGPEIHDYGVVDGEVFVECSSVNHVNFIASDYLNSGFSEWGEKNKNTITKAKFKLKGDEKYIRVECVDAFGNTAWTNPIFLK
jgi:hypothetical protein